MTHPSNETAPGARVRPAPWRTTPLAWPVAWLLALAVMVAAAAAQAKAIPDSFADLAAELLPAVVNVSTTQVIEGHSGPELPRFPPGSPFEEFFKEFFDKNAPPQQPQRKATSLGSGFIIDHDSKRYVVTNNHVIADADEITVILQDNSRIEAELVGRDVKTDIAVLDIKTDRTLPIVEFGDSDTARVGDWVIAIGNPFALGGTVTAGIISARHRDINSGPYDDFIQTDASINRGNSGGPMFNLEGRVIGINTAIFSPSGGSVGIGFAIPSSTAWPVIRQLIEHGEMRRGWLGVQIQSVTEEIAESLGMEEQIGALVANIIPGGPAEKAEIRSGDVIIEFDGKAVTEMRQLPRIVAETEVGEEVEVVLWRDSAERRVSVTIDRLDEGKTQVAARTTGGSEGSERTFETLGLTLSRLIPEVREKFGLPKEAKGVVVTRVADSGAAAEKSIRPGDIIVEISQEEVDDPADVAAKIEDARQSGRKSVLLLIEGQAGLRFVALRIDQG